MLILRIGRALLAALIVLGSTAFSHAVLAEEKGTQELAKAAQNPVAAMISLPFQNNVNFHVGPGDDVQNVLNIQPVIPLTLNEEWNLITRTIVPVIYQPELVPGAGSDFGLGDINLTLFLSPADAGKLIWGVGPVFVFSPLLRKTRSGQTNGAQPFGGGPDHPGSLVVGLLLNNVWSFGGDEDRKDVNQLLLQYFLNYNMPRGWYVSSAPILTANSEANSGNQWTLPVGGGLGKIFRIGKQPMNAQVQGFYNLDKPVNGPDWTLRVQLQFLFPK